MTLSIKEDSLENLKVRPCSPHPRSSFWRISNTLTLSTKKESFVNWRFRPWSIPGIYSKELNSITGSDFKILKRVSCVLKIRPQSIPGINSKLLNTLTLSTKKDCELEIWSWSIPEIVYKELNILYSGDSETLLENWRFHLEPINSETFF